MSHSSDKWYYFDPAVIERAQQGDEEALDLFGRQLLATVKPFLLKIRRSHGFRIAEGEIDDLVGDVVLKVMKKLPQYRSDAPFRYYLSTIILNHLRDTVPRLQRSLSLDAPLRQKLDDDSSATTRLDRLSNLDGKAKLENRDILNLLNTFIETMDDDLKRRCIRDYVNSRQYRFIVDDLGMPMGTVSNVIHLFKKEFLEWLEEH